MLVAAVGAAAVVGLPTSGAFASASHPNPAGQVIELGPSPTGVPANCPFPNQDASFQVVGGNEVSHGSSNKNGDWGGNTFEGTATFQEAPFSTLDSNGNPIDSGPPVPYYTGHLTYWSGGGNNASGQAEGGFTLDFHGSGPDGSLALHVDVHQTANDHSTPTANVQNVSITCS
jgi:hypothetical protein